jgi:hypothetical protein
MYWSGMSTDPSENKVSKRDGTVSARGAKGRGRDAEMIGATELLPLAVHLMGLGINSDLT